jgi:ribosomal protein L7Ae-like RNA K-turn-binding protein
VNGRLLGLLGIALKGRNIVLGREAVRLAVRRERVRLLVLAADAGSALEKEMRRLGEGTGLEVVRGPGRAELGGALGRSEISVAGITDDGLADAVKKAAGGEWAERPR